VKKGVLSGLLMAVLTLAWVGTAPQAPAVAAATCDGVWVVVDFGSLGGISTDCATSYGTGKEALSSAGFSPVLDNGMLTQISGKPTSPDPNKYYWSYWHATAKADGSYSGWSYSALGAAGYHPKAGNAEGWHYVALSDGKAAPGASPPKSAPAPTPTPTKSSPKPTPTATKKATPKPSASASPTKTASASASASATPKASETRSTTPTPDPAATPAGSESTTAVAAGQVTPTQPAPDNGSPVGAIAAGAAVLAGGAGVGGWWLLKGRRR
jgi:hypothetical protein